MSWIQLQVATDQASAEAIGGLMEAEGAVSVTLTDAADQPLFEPGPGETPLWNDIVLRALFSANTDTSALLAKLEKDFFPAILPAVEIETIEDQDWERAWMDDFQPLAFGKRLWICPSWCEPPEADAVIIKLDPGLAFGTGTHPTTALCLDWLDAAALKGQTLIDYGCGSGILGIAALLLGAAKVYGVDNDPQALTASADNCEKNELPSDSFPLFLPEAFARELSSGKLGHVDGLIANILAGPLIELSGYLSAMIKPGGWILLSGILREQADDVIAAYEGYIDFEPRSIRHDWVSLAGKRR